MTKRKGVNMEERRRYPRYPVRYDLKYRAAKDASAKREHAIVENVSRTGLKIRLSGTLKENEVLELTIYKSLGDPPISAYGRVVWHKESPLVYGEKQAGIELTKIGWSDTGKLIDTRG